MSGQNIPAMAWRNLWRNRRRTLLTLFSIVFGVFLAIMFTSMQDRNWSDMIDLAARLGGGHVSIQHRDYRLTPSLRKSIRGTAHLTELALDDSRIIGVTERISGQTMLNTARESFGSSFIAFDPEREDRTTLSLLDPDALLAGSMFETAHDRGIILGSKLAENLGVSLHSKVVYMITDKEGEIVSGMARVTGLIRTGAPQLDAGLSLLPLDTIRGIIGYAPDEVSQLAVFVNDQRASEDVAERLGERVTSNEIAVLPWNRNQPDLAAFIAMKVGGTRFISAFIGLLVAAGIFNTLFVSVMERMREFGILTAIGFSPLRLFGLVMMESFWLAVVGLVGAAVVTIGPYRYLAASGINVGKLLEDQGTIDVAGVAMSTVLKVGIFPESVVAIVLIALGAILLAGIYPAWRASSVDPVRVIALV